MIADEELKVLTQGRQATEKGARKEPCCRKCRMPMKGHKRGQCSSGTVE